MTHLAKRPTRLRLALVPVAALGLAPAAFGGETPAPLAEPLSAAASRFRAEEARVNGFTSSTQERAALALDAAGGAVVVWDSRRQEAGTYGVRLQRFAPSGAPVGGEIAVNAFRRSMQMRPAVAIDGAGGVWTAWESFGQDGSLAAVLARRFEPDFSNGTDEILVNERTRGAQSAPVLAGLPDGGALAVWTTPGAGNARRLAGRLLARDGRPVGGEFAVSGEDGFLESIPAIATDGAGRLVVVWAAADERGVPRGIRARLFDAGGKPAGAAFAADAGEGEHRIEPAVAMGGDGKFSVAWLASEGEDYRVEARHFDASGRPEGPPERVSAPADRAVSGAAIARRGSRVLAAWNAAGDGGAADVKARFLGKGEDGPAFALTRHLAGDQRLEAASGQARVSLGADGRVAAAWSGATGANDDSGVALSVLVPEGAAYALRSPEAALGDAGGAALAAMPHEPPVYDPATEAKDPLGGDTLGPALGPDGFIGIVNSGWTPPDPHMSVGPSHIVLITNGAIAFFTKDGTKTFEDEIEDAFGFWGGVGATGFVFDPETIYDPHSGRHMAMACERSNTGRSLFLLAVSDDSDPNGTWHKYRFDVTSLADNSIDSPNLAADATAVYLTSDHFSAVSYLVFIVEKAPLLSGGSPATRSLTVSGVQSFGVPVTYDADAPAQYMIEAFETSTASEVRLHAIRNPLTSPTRVTANVAVPVYGTPEDPPQMGTSVRPELFEARFWSAVYRNGSLWAVHHQNAARVRVRWYEFSMNGWPASGNPPTLAQSGEVDPGSPVRTFFPSIWVDDFGNAVVTCARSSSTEFISMARAVRYASDPAGTFRPLEIVRSSTAAYGTARWGDYSATSDDPAEPGRFWSHHEYSPGGGSWNTFVASVRLSSTIVPDSFDVVRGALAGGNVASLASDDGNRLAVLAAQRPSPLEPSLTLLVVGISPSTAPAALSFAIESRVDAPNLGQTLSLFDHEAGVFEVVDIRAATSADSVATVVPPGDPARFVDPATNEMTLRVTFKAVAPVFRFPWRAEIDRVAWTTTP